MTTLLSKIELNRVFIELLPPNIIVISLKDKSVLETEDIAEIKEIDLELTKGEDYVVVAISGDYTSISKDAREFLVSNPMEKKRKALAFVINSLSHRILGNFFIKVNKPSAPTKIFTTKEEAIIWAKKILIDSSNAL